MQDFNVDTHDSDKFLAQVGPWVSKTIFVEKHTILNRECVPIYMDMYAPLEKPAQEPIEESFHEKNMRLVAEWLIHGNTERPKWGPHQRPLNATPAVRSALVSQWCPIYYRSNFLVISGDPEANEDFLDGMLDTSLGDYARFEEIGNAEDIFNLFSQCICSKQDYEHIIRITTDPKLCVLEDLGSFSPDRESLKDMFQVVVADFLSARANSDELTVITTSCTEQEILEKLGPEVVEIIFNKKNTFIQSNEPVEIKPIKKRESMWSQLVNCVGYRWGWPGSS